MVSTTPPRIRHSQSALDGLQQQQQTPADSSTRASHSSTGQLVARKSPDHASLSSASSHCQSRVMRKKSFEKLPLKKTLSAHLPRVVAVGGVSNLYGEWSNDSTTELQVDPAIYDLDYDDVSEAGSDFTEDYSRHRAAIRTGVEGMAIPRYNGEEGFDDDDDHSSLSSAGSFANEDDDDDWSGGSSNSSSAVDSRILQHTKEQAAGHSTSEVHMTPISGDEHLLEDHTELSVEEDPLFNMSGALKQFDLPLVPAKTTKIPLDIHPNVTVDDDMDDDLDDNDEWSDEDPSESLAQSERSTIWKETPDGRFVPLVLQPLAAQPPPPPAIYPRKSIDSHTSMHSQESEYSVDSFAGERTPPSKRKGSNNDSQGQKRKSRRSQDRTTIVPLQPDAKLRVDTSDDEQEETEPAERLCTPPSLALTTLEEVLVFSDDEKEPPKSPTTKAKRTPSTTKISPSRRRSSTLAAESIAKSKDKPVFRSESPNPVVPTPISILSQSLPMKQWDNVPIDDQLHYSVDFTRIRISPNEYRAPLKDHSKRSRKSKKPKDPKKTTTTTTTTKKKSPKKPKVKENTSSRSLGVRTSSKSLTIVEGVESDVESAAESVSSTERNDDDNNNNDNSNNKTMDNNNDDDSENGSIASQESLDSMDAAGVNKNNANKKSSGKDDGDKKSKKADKKKRKKDKVRKRGRRAEYEEETLVDATSLTVKQASAAVADRVEAIFTNLQMIYDKTLREEQEQQRQLQQQPSPKIETSVRSMPSPEMEQEIISFLGSSNKPEKIRVRSKASEAVLEQQQNDDKKATDKGDSTRRSRTKSRSKSRSRSISKDPAKSFRSRSKSKEPALNKVESRSGRSRSKSISRSKSMDDAEGMVVDPTTVRRKLRKEIGTSQEPLMGSMASSLQVKDSKPNKVSSTTTKKEKSNEKSSRRSRSPRRMLASTKDPTPPPATESPLRLQDLIDDSERDGHEGIHDTLRPQLTRENSGLTVEHDVDLAEEEMVDPQSKLEWLEARIAEIEQSTKDKTAAMKEEYDKRRADVEAKVMAEKEKTNPVQAILLLHKIKVNHYHESGRFMKKELQSMEKRVKQQMMKCSELTMQAQEWQSKTMSMLLQIQQMERANTQQSRLLEQCRMEFQEVQEALWKEQMLHATQIGDFEEYKLETKTPLFRQWREPTPRDMDAQVLRASYQLPRSSIFYNVLEDDECRLLFKR